MTDAALAIRLTADASDASAAFEDVGVAAKGMADDVDTATRSADAAASRLDGVAESSDNVASKGAQAAGAMSGLGELMGGPFGSAMMTGGNAMQAAADSGDLLNVVTESAIVRKVKDTAVTVAQKAANLATAAATRVAAAAQWAWNAAMSANPIGLIIAAVVLLVGGFILLYKRSERFRSIVQAVMRAASAAIRAVWAVLRRVGAFVVNVLIGYFRLYRTVVVAVFNAVRAVVTAVLRRVVDVAQGVRDRFVAVWGAIRDAAGRVWGAIKQGISDKLAAVRQLAADVQRKFGEVWEGIKTKAIGVFQDILTPIQTAIDKVQSLIDWISKIDLPDLGDLNPFAAGFGRGSSTSAVAPTATGGVVVNINVTAGVGDPLAIAAEVDKVVRRRAAYLGGRP